MTSLNCKSLALSPAIGRLRIVLLGPPLPGTGDGDTFTNGSLCPAFRQIGSKGRELSLLSAVSQSSSARKNPYAQVALSLGSMF